MIVRVMTEGQFNIDGNDLDKLNEVDNQIVEALAASDQTRFEQLMKQINDLVCKNGRPVPVDQFVESDIILPPPDASMDEVREMFAGEGLIPG
jgi:hypothetical protein